MDKNQKLICDMVRQKPECISERSILRAALLDILPNDKLCQNVLLNAFDSDIIKCFRNNSDATLSALNFISQLEKDYGITKDIAFWAVQTWCYLLQLDQIADALVVLQPANQVSVQTPIKNTPKTKEYYIGLGVYRAGTDFPIGEISVQAITKPRLDIKYGVGKNPQRINCNEYFMDKMYVRMEEGTFLKLYSFETGVNHQFIVKSME